MSSYKYYIHWHEWRRDISRADVRLYQEGKKLTAILGKDKKAGEWNPMIVVNGHYGFILHELFNRPRVPAEEVRTLNLKEASDELLAFDKKLFVPSPSPQQLSKCDKCDECEGPMSNGPNTWWCPTQNTWLFSCPNERWPIHPSNILKEHGGTFVNKAETETIATAVSQSFPQQNTVYNAKIASIEAEIMARSTRAKNIIESIESKSEPKWRIMEQEVERKEQERAQERSKQRKQERTEREEITQLSEILRNAGWSKLLAIEPRLDLLELRWATEEMKMKSSEPLFTCRLLNTRRRKDDNGY
jgi:hypothetical protein